MENVKIYIQAVYFYVKFYFKEHKLHQTQISKTTKLQNRSILALYFKATLLCYTFNTPCYPKLHPISPDLPNLSH